ncbi:MAG: SpoIIE family protein phosphatase [Sterolibacteriaceae bacterium MAG5]|nr:SpoIIE family protein phosphatase [Candidatus Nitricoxidireducens bremensis]
MDASRSVEDLRQMSVLYVEDERSIADEVAYFLRPRVGRLLTAADGQEGLEVFRAQRPDLVLTDIQMPRLDGLSMAAEIKQLHREVPVIVTTAINDSQHLQRAIAAGVDGYALKPIHLEQLLQTLLRSTELLMQAREIATSRAQLAAYHQAAEEERKLVADLMAKVMRPESLRDSQLHYWLRPAEIIGGDLIAVARNRDDKLYVMLADSSGHGLPAALNLLPINHIFHSSVSKNLSVALMVEEMNWAVREQSPTERYVSALVACIDARNRIVEVWNGGLPGAFLMDGQGAVVRSFASDNFPLGILDRTFTARTDIHQWSAPCQLIVYSDGVEDVEDEAGHPFGSQRVVAALQAEPPERRCAGLGAAIDRHMGGHRAFDDMTLMIVDCSAPADT